MTAMIEKDDATGVLPDAGPVLFEQTIPRHLVHRAAVAEVFVTDLHVTNENTFHVGAQWPRGHSFFGPRTTASHDPLIFAETIRQAALLVSHAALGVPKSDRFLLHDMSVSVDMVGLRTADRPVDIVVVVRAHDIRRRGDSIGGIRLEFSCYRDGRKIGTAGLGWSCASAAGYRRVRGDRFSATPYQATLLPAVKPQLVGRDRPEDVVLAETPLHNVWSLQANPGHPVMFDHPVDHVPGMVLLEAARQATLLTVGKANAVPRAMEFTFRRFVEFEDPCLVIADDQGRTRGGRRLGVTFEQCGRTVATGTMELADA
ncbi:A-factor biosynthesis hotdog protein [Herbihabitans rhizosphaerae]|uniref:A-factor biosynthesis hotdog protein n=1 Tax=Herbihabitans rhizosphaerae TaxID=1872711 RepID=A0A4Q7KJ51_9PSEU|nr:ScbA/BarX family gamma-butyrolactone biosynthesis protein [Herbihabitans rhizosphaerae]RZS36579.1 A-factor biosynthesis hotdog protein [Herbihabitans rhizosphaerae]